MAGTCGKPPNSRKFIVVIRPPNRQDTVALRNPNRNRVLDWLRHTLFFKGPQPISKLPDITEDHRPRRPMLTVCRLDSPIQIDSRWNGEKGRTVVPITWGQAKVKSNERPCNREMPHNGMLPYF